MKSLIKFFPVAVGVLALASCSNDDFFGSSSEDGKLELVATVAAPAGSDDGLITRSVITPAENVADYSTSWQTDDVFRVYDAQLQKYDAFSFKAESGKITIDTESPKVTEYAKAIFPGESVSYAGWSADNDAVTATVEIGNLINYKPAVKVGDKTAYVSNLPMWGDATMNEDHLAVNLNPLTAYADITVYGGAAVANYIRVISTNSDNADADAGKGWGHEDEITGNQNDDHIQKAPLTGYFDAMLVDGGQMAANLTAPLADKYGCYIKVNLTGNTADESHVIIPIVAQKYDKLIIQYYDGVEWQELKAYDNLTVPNNVVIRKDLVIGTAIKTQDAKVSKFSEINDRLTTFNKEDGEHNKVYAGVKVINIDLADGVAADAIKTSAGDANQIITIPDYGEEKIINLNFDIDDTGYNLTIKNQNTKATVLNLQTIKGSSAVTINQGTITAENEAFVITGEINSTGSGESKRLTIDNTGKLTLGLGSFGPFKSDMNLYLTKSVNKLYIDAAEGNTIPAIDASADDNASVINIKSGTVTAIGGTKAATTHVTVDGGTVTTLKTKAAITVNKGTVGTAETEDAVVDIQGGTVTKVTNKNQNVIIGANATVGEVTTAAAGGKTVTVNSALTKLTMTGASTLTITDATVGELNVNVLGATINLDGTTKLAQITSLKTNKTEGDAIVVSSTGEAAILAVSADARFSFTSTWNGKKAAIGSDNKIYTAAQLASVTTGKAYTLLTNVTAFSKWTPVNISKDFDGNNKTLTGLNAPLFGTISGGTVKKLNLATVNINTDAANQGALAQTVSGTTTINEITVTGTIGKATDGKATTKNIGGLIGTANGTVTLDKNKVVATVQGYANVGGFIGNVAGGSVTFKANEAEASNVTFKQTFEAATTIDMNEGTFGNFIGSITGEGANVTIGGADKLGANFAAFFGANDAVKAALDASKISFAKNKVGDPAKTYQGMKTAIVDRTLTYEIGYSPVQAVGTVILYGTITDELGNDIKVKINHINQYN